MDHSSEELSRRLTRWAPFIVAALAILLFLPAIGSFGLWDPYEVKVADFAKEAAQAGWSPARGMNRPPAPVWLVVAGFKMFGVGEGAGRAPIAIASVLLVIACFYLATGLLRRRGALLGAFALATSPAVFLGARQLTTEVLPLLAATTAVLGLASAAWPRPGRASGLRVLDLALGLFGLGLGVLSSGFFLGVAIPLTAVAAALLLSRGPLGLGLAGLAAALGAWVATAISWAHAMPGAGRPGAYSLVIGGTPHQPLHQTTLTTVLLQMGFGLFPWIALLPLAAARAFTSQRAEPDAPASRGSGEIAPATPATGDPAAPLARREPPIVEAARRSAAERNVVIGAVLLLIGLAVTGISFSVASSGGTYVVTTGLIAVGIANILRGLMARAPNGGAASPTAAAAPPAEPAAPTEGDAALEGQERYGRVVLLSWLVVAYLGTTLFSAGVADVGFSAAAAVALLAGAYLDDVLDGATGAPLAGWIVLLAAATVAHDLFLAPEKYAAHILEGIKWPSPLSIAPYVVLALGCLWGLAAAFGVGLKSARLRGAAVAAALGLALVAAGAGTFSIIPSVSKHLSYKGLFSKYKTLGGAGGELGQYRVPGHGAAYYNSGGKTTDLATLPALFEFLAKPARVFVIVGSEDMAPIDQHSRSQAQNVPYYVVDDTNSHFLLLSNKLGPGEKDLNPLKRQIVQELPRPPQHELHADFEGKVELVGYDLPAELERGHTFKITLYYRVLQPLGSSYKVFLHFDGPGTRFNGDHVPLDGRFPTNYWVPGYYVIDEHEMEPDRSTAPSGWYQIYGGMFLGDTRLKVVSGPQDGENRVKIGSVRVK